MESASLLSTWRLQGDGLGVWGVSFPNEPPSPITFTRLWPKPSFGGQKLVGPQS